MDVNVVIEISKGSNVKYEYDSKTKRLICDRILQTPVSYFFNYGFIENTLSDDNDSLDAVVLCDESLFPTCHILCRPVGVLHTVDEHGDDPKIILVPSSSVNPLYDNIKDLNDINVKVLEKLKFFFENYKKMEKNKWVQTGDFYDRYTAEKTIERCQSAWKLKNTEN
jgi:inorganic pyrophosphatase